MSRVLVTDGEQRASLAIVRSLGRAGHEVFVCSSRTRSLAGASRYARAEACVPDALKEGDAFVAAIRDLLSRWSIDTLLPVSEASLLAVLPVRDQLGVTLPFAGLGAFRDLSNKEYLLRIAAEEGIAVPRQHVARTHADVAAMLARSELQFPLVVKPARSVSDAGNGRAKWGVAHAANAAELHRRIEQLPAAAYPLLLQQRVNGPGVGVFVLLWQDRVSSVFAHRRIREKPPSGGVSVYRESIVAPPELLDSAVRLLRRFRWLGVAMVEFKLDEKSGAAYLMEVNGRFWGSLQLAIDAGVDFPRLLLECAAGEHVSVNGGYRAGLRSRWWWGDVDHLIARLRRSRAALDLPADAPGAWQAVRDFVRIRPGRDKNEVLRRNDPWPFVRETVDWLRNRS